MNLSELKPIVEALVFASDAPVTLERIQETLEDADAAAIEQVVEELNREYAESGRSFFIRKVGGGYHISTKPEFHGWIKKLFFGRQKYRLTQASMETLAIIAFKQPISRVDIAQIRGVNSDAVVGTLMERKLVTITGRSEGVGRPLLYGTTPEFLKYFGINDLAELPKPREIEELFSKEGLPDEVAQLLAETDKQLSLPISFEGEIGKDTEVTEVSVADLSAGAALAAPALLRRPQADGAPPDINHDDIQPEDQAASPAPESAATSANHEATVAAPAFASTDADAPATALEKPSEPIVKDIIDALPDTLPGTTESEEGIGFYGLIADTPEVSEDSHERRQPPKPDFDEHAEAEDLDTLTHLTEDKPEALLQTPAEEEKASFATDTTELAAMEFNIREPEFPPSEQDNHVPDTLPVGFLTEDLGTTREFALLDDRLSEEESRQLETPLQELPASLETTNEILLATLVSMDSDDKENNLTSESGGLDLNNLRPSPSEELEPEPPAFEVDSWVADDVFNGESRPAPLDDEKRVEEFTLASTESDGTSVLESDLARIFAERDSLAAATVSSMEPPPATGPEAPERDVTVSENIAEETAGQEPAPSNTHVPPAETRTPQVEEGEQQGVRNAPPLVPVDAMSILDEPEEAPSSAEPSPAGPQEDILRADEHEESLPARSELLHRPDTSEMASGAEQPPEENMNAAQDQPTSVMPSRAAEPPFFVPAPAQIGASETMISSTEDEAGIGIVRLWRRAMNWFRSALQKLGRRA